MNKVNEIVLSKDTFGDELWPTVAQVLKILTRNEEICTVYDDDIDIIVIKHEHDDRHGEDYWGATNPYWRTPKQVEVLEYHEFAENTKADNTRNCEERTVITN